MTLNDKRLWTLEMIEGGFEITVDVGDKVTRIAMFTVDDIPTPPFTSRPWVWPAIATACGTTILRSYFSAFRPEHDAGLLAGMLAEQFGVAVLRCRTKRLESITALEIATWCLDLMLDPVLEYLRSTAAAKQAPSLN